MGFWEPLLKIPEELQQNNRSLLPPQTPRNKKIDQVEAFFHSAGVGGSQPLQAMWQGSVCCTSSRSPWGPRSQFKSACILDGAQVCPRWSFSLFQSCSPLCSRLCIFRPPIPTFSVFCLSICMYHIVCMVCVCIFCTLSPGKYPRPLRTSHSILRPRSLIVVDCCIRFRPLCEVLPHAPAPWEVRFPRVDAQ